MNCPNCSAPIDDDAKFCIYCGTKFGNKSCCSQCGNIIVPGTKFCTCCGAKLQSLNFNLLEVQRLKEEKEKAEQERLRKEREEARKAEQERIRQEELQEERRRAAIARDEKRRREAEQEKKTTRIIVVVVLALVLALGGCIFYFASPSKSDVSEEKTNVGSSSVAKVDSEYETEEESYNSYDEDSDASSYSASSSIDYVDLGLSVLWAECNIGASSATDNGWLVGWGAMDSQTTSKNLSRYPTSNPPHSISQTSYDIAKAMYGGMWRLPSLSELEELKDYCNWEVITTCGVNVYKVTGPNGNYIYLPFAGYRDGTELKREGEWGFIWSGELYEGNSQFGANLSFSVNGKVATSGFYRYGGESIRPVMSK